MPSDDFSSQLYLELRAQFRNVAKKINSLFLNLSNLFNYLFPGLLQVKEKGKKLLSPLLPQ